MTQQSSDIFWHPDFEDRAKQFYQVYDLLSIKGPGDENYSKRRLKHYTKRTCLFCNRSHPATSFSNDSHLIPQLIGNTNMYSDFECDECNDKFSTYENDLAEFLGVSRSLTNFHGPGKTFGFVARRLRAKSRSFIGDNILILAPEDLKREGNKTTISYTKNQFIPANVYRALLKSALSLLEISDITENYQHAIAYINRKTDFTQGASISGYRLSFSTNFPLHIYHFRKRKKTETVPTDVLIFIFQNHIVTIPLLFHKEDLFTKYANYNFVWPPPYFINEEAMETYMPLPFQRDLFSNQKVTDEEENLTLIIDQESLNNSVAINPDTGEITKTDPNSHTIKYIILTKGDMRIDPKTFSSFIKMQTEGL